MDTSSLFTNIDAELDVDKLQYVENLDNFLRQKVKATGIRIIKKADSFRLRGNVNSVLKVNESFHHLAPEISDKTIYIQSKKLDHGELIEEIEGLFSDTESSWGDTRSTKTLTMTTDEAKWCYTMLDKADQIQEYLFEQKTRMSLGNDSDGNCRVIIRGQTASEIEKKLRRMCEESTTSMSTQRAKLPVVRRPTAFLQQVMRDTRAHLALLKRCDALAGATAGGHDVTTESGYWVFTVLHMNSTAEKVREQVEALVSSTCHASTDVTSVLMKYCEIEAEPEKKISPDRTKKGLTAENLAAAEGKPKAKNGSDNGSFYSITDLEDDLEESTDKSSEVNTPKMEDLEREIVLGDEDIFDYFYVFGWGEMAKLERTYGTVIYGDDKNKLSLKVRANPSNLDATEQRLLEMRQDVFNMRTACVDVSTVPRKKIKEIFPTASKQAEEFRFMLKLKDTSVFVLGPQSMLDDCVLAINVAFGLYDLSTGLYRTGEAAHTTSTPGGSAGNVGAVNDDVISGGGMEGGAGGGGSSRPTYRRPHHHHHHHHHGDGSGHQAPPPPMFDDYITTEQSLALSSVAPRAYRVKSNEGWVYAWAADITQLCVDVIVNAANERLEHRGGVGLAIARAAGDAIELECEKLMATYGVMQVSEVHITTAGNMRAKKVFHTVGPQWNMYPDKTKCLQDLSKAFLNCLMRAHAVGYESIAFPAISSGIYGVPQELVAKGAIRAVTTFTTKYPTSKLKHIHFVVLQDETLAAFHYELDKHKDAYQLDENYSEYFDWIDPEMEKSGGVEMRYVVEPIRGTRPTSEEGATSLPHGGYERQAGDTDEPQSLPITHDKSNLKSQKGAIYKVQHKDEKAKSEGEKSTTEKVSSPSVKPKTKPKDNKSAAQDNIKPKEKESKSDSIIPNTSNEDPDDSDDKWETLTYEPEDVTAEVLRELRLAHLDPNYAKTATLKSEPKESADNSEIKPAKTEETEENLTEDKQSENDGNQNHGNEIGSEKHLAVPKADLTSEDDDDSKSELFSSKEEDTPESATDASADNAGDDTDTDKSSKQAASKAGEEVSPPSKQANTDDTSEGKEPEKDNATSSKTSETDDSSEKSENLEAGNMKPTTSDDKVDDEITTKDDIDEGADHIKSEIKTEETAAATSDTKNEGKTEENEEPSTTAEQNKTKSGNLADKDKEKGSEATSYSSKIKHLKEAGAIPKKVNNAPTKASKIQTDGTTDKPASPSKHAHTHISTRPKCKAKNRRSKNKNETEEKQKSFDKKQAEPLKTDITDTDPVESTKVDNREDNKPTKPDNNENEPTMPDDKEHVERTMPDDKEHVERTIPDDKEHVEPSESCSICLEKPNKPKILDKCKHVFCEECIDTSFQKINPKCPNCGVLYGELQGNQPEGHMLVTYHQKRYLSGHHGYGHIMVEYFFADGIQQENHPNPGHPYHGTQRQAYLPDTKEGNHVLELLRRAFNAGLVFTIGRSSTTGREDCVIWNNIHHKTSPTGGPQMYGYPDPTYLQRVQEELAALGIQ